MGQRVSYVLLLLFPYSLYAQEEVPAEQAAQLEQMSEQDQPALENDESFQQLEIFTRRKLNLNTADAASLQSLGLLDPLRIAQLLAYRRTLGALISIYELQAVPGFDLPLIRSLLPFVDAGNALEPYYTWKDYLRKGHHTLLLRMSRPMETAKGYLTDDSGRVHYNGSPDKTLLRYRYRFGRYASWGLVMGKDAGEKGFDHYAMHLFLQFRGRIRTLALGDYTVNMGQGLIQWHGLAFGKGGAVMQVKREGDVLKPYASAGEFYFYRGAGVTGVRGRTALTAFVSCRALDARAPAKGTDSLEQGSLVTTGYHRTAAELALRHNILQYSAGAVLKQRFTAGHIALNMIGHRFSGSLQKGTALYQRYAWEGDRLFNASVDHAWGWRNFHFFGETAVDQQGKIALVQGVLASLAEGADVALVYRRQDAAYQALYGNAFGERSTPGNESGMYTALYLRWGSRWQLSAYADVFRFPWLKYRVSAPSGGHDLLLALTWQPDKATELHLRYHTESKPQDVSVYPAPERYPVAEKRQQLRCQLTLPLSGAVSWRCRMQFAEQGGREAWLAQQQWRAKWRQWRIVAGYTRFEVAEGDVFYLSGEGFPGDNTLARYAGKGWSTQVQVQYQFFRSLTLWCRWQFTISPGREGIGSGWEAIQGNKKNIIQLQLQWMY